MRREKEWMIQSVFSVCIAIGLSYLLGCINTGYYYARLTTGQDIRLSGSGSAVATNAGRLLGIKGFVVTFIGDALKGGLSVWIARNLTSSVWIGDAALIMVVVGHIWPIQLGWRGGKGGASALGALTILDARLPLLYLILFALAFCISRNKMGSALVAIVLLPAVTVLLRFPEPHTVCLTALALLLAFSHRDNLSRSLLPKSANSHSKTNPE